MSEVKLPAIDLVILRRLFMKRLHFYLPLTILLLIAHVADAQVTPAVKPDGTVVEREKGFPFETYEKWISCLREHQPSFDEARFKNFYSKQDFEKYKNELDYQRIRYLSDGLKVVGYIIKPKRTDGKKLPVIIFNRGGTQEFGRLNFEHLFHYFYLVADGYILVASQYRGNAGGEGREEHGGADVNDVLNLIPVIESIPEADASRIGMYGWSRGGMMTYIVLTRTDRIAAAIIGAGLADAFDYIKRRPKMEKDFFSKLIPNYAGNKEAALKARSTVHWPEKLCKRTPILLLHGSSDRRVHPNQALRMASLLYENKHPFRFVFFEGGDHGLSEHREEVERLVKDWLDRYVRDRRPWPSLEPHGR
jgi:dipeptidyl aminopeptidase/acylaminoacyl peptidase